MSRDLSALKDVNKTQDWTKIKKKYNKSYRKQRVKGRININQAAFANIKEPRINSEAR